MCVFFKKNRIKNFSDFTWKGGIENVKLNVHYSKLISQSCSMYSIRTFSSLSLALCCFVFLFSYMCFIAKVTNG